MFYAHAQMSEHAQYALLQITKKKTDIIINLLMTEDRSTFRRRVIVDNPGRGYQ